MKKYDAVIIGFGKGGKTLAGTLAANGKNVALIEKEDRKSTRLNSSHSQQSRMPSSA